MELHGLQSYCQEVDPLAVMEEAYRMSVISLQMIVSYKPTQKEQYMNISLK